MPIYPYEIYFSIQEPHILNASYILADRVIVRDRAEANCLFVDSSMPGVMRQGIRLNARTAKDAAFQAEIKIKYLVQQYFPELSRTVLIIQEIIPIQAADEIMPDGDTYKESNHGVIIRKN